MWSEVLGESLFPGMAYPSDHRAVVSEVPYEFTESRVLLLKLGDSAWLGEQS